MNRLTTVSTKGQLVIPQEMRETLGIGPGTRIAVTLQGPRIILEPVSEKLVDETRGMFAGGPSLSSLLKKTRAEDKGRRREKDKW
jgi:AbrB family looped-hinge helix DNA binding protein